jgi:hypothetical protein
MNLFYRSFHLLGYHYLVITIYFLMSIYLVCYKPLNQQVQTYLILLSFSLNLLVISITIQYTFISLISTYCSMILMLLINLYSFKLIRSTIPNLILLSSILYSILFLIPIILILLKLNTLLLLLFLICLITLPL